MTLVINDLTADADSAPIVEVLVTGLDPAVSSVTAWRTSGGVEKEVSGIVRAPVAGAGSWVDYEVPAQQATYRIEYFDAGGVPLGYSEPATVTLGFTGIWMHNPLAPSGAVRVELHAEAGRVLSRPVPNTRVRPKGRPAGVIIAEPRVGLVGAVFSVWSRDLATADRVQAFLGSPKVSLLPVVCVRFGADYPQIRVASPLFLGVDDIPEEDRTLRYGGEATVQHIVGDEAERPAPGIFIPLLRRKDVNAAYSSRAEFNAAYLSRLAANRDYSLAGFAGD